MRSLALKNFDEPRIPLAQRLPIYFVLMVMACLALSGCRSGEVNSLCYWGPIPNEKKMKELKAKGVKTIVNCRLNRLVAKEKIAEELGLNWVHIPTGLFKPPGDEQIKRFVAVANNPDMTPIFICDQAARDRTQFYAAVFGMASEKWSAEKASKAMYLNGLRHWWPWFYKYKEVVKQYEPEIHGEIEHTADSNVYTTN
ncbi:MAG: hypothetical protein IAF58_14060 [Leptolyngbya sp.]|nr:hypothetical protein [Candidatus Melainabacteria bacterium]